jgi:hypothetical protein
MDALFEDAPAFVPGTRYAKVGDRFAAEDELRHGTYTPSHPRAIRLPSFLPFLPSCLNHEDGT